MTGALIALLAIAAAAGWSLAGALLLGAGCRLRDTDGPTAEVTVAGVPLARVRVAPGRAITSTGIVQLRDPIVVDAAGLRWEDPPRRRRWARR